MPGDPVACSQGAPPRSWWSRYWFPVMSPARLAVMRIVMPVFYLAWFMDPLSMHLHKAQPAAGFRDPQGLVFLLSGFVPEAALRHAGMLTALWWLTVAAGIATAVGAFSRASAAVFAMGVWYLISHEYSYGDYHHADPIFTLLLMMLPLVPCGRALSVDAWRAQRRGADASAWGLAAQRDDVYWPLRLTQWLIALMYLNAGVAKLLGGGLHWMNGYTMQTYLLRDGLRRDRPLGLWLAEHHHVCQLMSMGAVGFELSFWLCMVWRRLTPIYLLGGLAMHLGIFVLQGARFWQVLVLYLCWLPWERWLRGPAVAGSGRLAPAGGGFVANA